MAKHPVLPEPVLQRNGGNALARAGLDVLLAQLEQLAASRTITTRNACDGSFSFSCDCVVFRLIVSVVT